MTSTVASAAAFNWTQLTPSTPLPASSGAAADYDAATSQFVVFGAGATGGTESSATWVFQSGNWTHLTPPHSPAGRQSAVMAFDSASNQLVLFGGVSFAGGKVKLFSDTWIWTGTDWTQLFPAHHPSAREATAMAFDGVTQDLILFGGGTRTGDPRDTRTWNGSDWTKLAPAHKPTGRIQAAMAALGSTHGVVG